MIINGVELPDIDTADADVMEHYENALDAFSVKMKNIDTKNVKASQVIRTECRAVFELFNELFGEGVDRRVFGDKCNLNICMNAFNQLTTAVRKLDEANANRLIALQNNNRNQSAKRQNGKKKNHYNNRPQLVANNGGRN